MRRILLLISFFIVLAGQNLAQDHPIAPIFDALKLIPDLPTSRGITTLVDRNVIAEAYLDAQKPATLTELLDAKTMGHQVWWKVFMNLGDTTARNLLQSDTLPQRLGIEFMQIGVTATFGTPPDNGIVLSGTFDQAVITATLTAREYTQTDSHVWCYQGDCDNGSRANFDLREPGDPFGGELGRTQPISVGNTVLVSSPSAEIVAAVQALQDKGGVSLADDVAYQAIASALSAEGILLQVTFVDGEILQTSSVLENRDELPTSAGFTAIAPYRLYAMADAVTDTQQVAIVAFAYANEVDATSAMEQIQFRLGVLDSLATKKTWQTLLNDRHITLRSQVISVGDQFVGLIRFETPKATTAQILASNADTSDAVVQPGAVYLRLLLSSFARSDQQWRLWNLDN